MSLSLVIADLVPQEEAGRVVLGSILALRPWSHLVSLVRVVVFSSSGPEQADQSLSSVAAGSLLRSRLRACEAMRAD